jgi:hypothetical protein
MEKIGNQKIWSYYDDRAKVWRALRDRRACGIVAA